MSICLATNGKTSDCRRGNQIKKLDTCERLGAWKATNWYGI